jgi:BirA family biotin operon repressor/biotin-[acetyl-CoA-carboxylase] ligase
VNDLVSGGRKLCGILTEMSVESETGMIDNIIIGIGININNDASDFPDEIKDIATSIALEAGHAIDRSELAAAMVEELDRMRADWPDNKAAYLEAYRQADITCGRDVNVIQGGNVRPAEALMINDDFSLKVRFSDGQVSDLSSGEVSLKIL